MSQKAAIDMMPRKLPGSEFSHTGAWAYLRANQLRHVGVDVKVLGDVERGQQQSDWSQYDVIYCYHTMDFDPEHPYLINIFDGPQEHVAKFFERLIWDQNSSKRFISLDYPMPNYGYRCKRKLDRAGADTKMSDYWRNVNWDAVQEKCEAITDWLLDPGLELTRPYVGRTREDWIQQCAGVKHLHPRVVMGDSHSFSAYRPPAIVLRKDGRTMSGILKKGIKGELRDAGMDYDQVQQLTLYYGNIDVRHHLCRAHDPKQEAINLINRYEQEVLTLLRDGKEVELVWLLPIEDESRKLPSTGYYQGTPFFGSRAQRQELVKVINDGLDRIGQVHGLEVYRWPDHWYSLDGLEVFNIMERPRSVHLARKFYRWDLEADKPNAHHTPTKRVSLFEF